MSGFISHLLDLNSKVATIKMPLIGGSQIPYKRQTCNVVHQPLIFCKLLFLRMRVVNWNFIIPPWEGATGILSIWLNPKLRCWTSDKYCNGKTEHGSRRDKKETKACTMWTKTNICLSATTNWTSENMLVGMEGSKAICRNLGEWNWECATKTMVAREKTSIVCVMKG